MFVLVSDAFLDASLRIDGISMIAHPSLPLLGHVDSRLRLLSESVECLHAALCDERFDLFRLQNVTELVERVRDLVPAESEREGIIDEKLVGLTETELELVCVKHLAIQFGTTLSHFDKIAPR